MKTSQTNEARRLDQNLAQCRTVRAAAESAFALEKIGSSKGGALTGALTALIAAEAELEKTLRFETASERPHADLVKATLAAVAAIRAAEIEIERGTFDRDEALRRRDNLDAARAFYVACAHQEKEAGDARGSNRNTPKWNKLAAQIALAESETNSLAKQYSEGAIMAHDHYGRGAARQVAVGVVECGLRLAFEPAAIAAAGERIKENAERALERRTIKPASLSIEGLKRIFDERFVAIWTLTLSTDASAAREALQKAARAELSSEVQP